MKRPLTLALLLATLSITGIVGMLVAEGVWDRIFFVMAATPAGFGGAMVFCRQTHTRRRADND